MEQKAQVIWKIVPLSPTRHLHQKAIIMEIQDGGGVSGSNTNLLPGLIWNYNSVVEKSSGITNYMLAGEKPYSHRQAEETTSP